MVKSCQRKLRSLGQRKKWDKNREKIDQQLWREICGSMSNKIRDVLEKVYIFIYTKMPSHMILITISFVFRTIAEEDTYSGAMTELGPLMGKKHNQASTSKDPNMRVSGRYKI